MFLDVAKINTFFELCNKNRVKKVLFDLFADTPHGLPRNENAHLWKCLSKDAHDGMPNSCIIA